MSQLKIYQDSDPADLLLHTEDGAVMAAELGRIGVRFARWETPVRLAGDEPAAAILQAYEPYLDELMGEGSAGTADVLSLHPDHPDVPALRQKFLAEHIHTEDEIRFFVAGCGNFVLHVDGKVFDAHCEAGDLISVPAHTKHWFDAGAAPSFTVLRVYTDPAGWVAHFTGDDISTRFPVA